MTNARIYLDANVFIYAIETKDAVSDHLRQLLNLIESRGVFACTSELSLAEVNVRAIPPHRRDYLDLMVVSRLIDLRPVTRDILLDTANYRSFLNGQYGTMPKLPDAIHVMTAVDAGCNTFVSFDRRLKLPQPLRRVGRENDGILQLIETLKE